jgi:hypothetical protein
MSRRRTFVVALAWLATIVSGALVFVARTGSSYADSSFSLVLGGLVLGITTHASVGAILTLRRPGNVVGLVLMLGAVLSAITLLTWISGAAMTAQRGGDDVLAGLLSLIGGLGFFPTLIVFLPLLALLFPSGRLPGRSWRWPVRGIFAALAVTLATGLLHPGQIPGSLANNPLGSSMFSGSEPFWIVGLVVAYSSLPVALVIALAAVIVRARRSRGVERAQLKWFVAANVAVGALLTLALADGGMDLGLYAGISPTIFDFLAVASLSLPGAAVGVAIMRYHLFEIDRIISRTLSWALVTGLLGAVFVGLVVGLQALSTKVTGTNTLAVAASTLVVAAAFQPLRRRVQGQVDRRFNRATYDAQQTTDAFAAQLRDEVDLARLRDALVERVDESMRPASASVWLRAGSGR